MSTRASESWIRSAHRHLEAARSLTDSYPEWACTAAYYAVYSMARAMLTPEVEPKRHATVPRLLARYATDLHHSWGRRFDAMQRLRVRCTYGGYLPGRDEAHETLADAKTLVGEARAFLRR